MLEAASGIGSVTLLPYYQGGDRKKERKEGTELNGRAVRNGTGNMYNDVRRCDVWCETQGPKEGKGYPWADW